MSKKHINYQMDTSGNSRSGLYFRGKGGHSGGGLLEVEGNNTGKDRGQAPDDKSQSQAELKNCRIKK